MSENPEPILPVPPLPCDHPTATFDVRTGKCLCVVCARCGKHTGNSTQGHYWSYCKVTDELRDWHFCCPGDCELEAEEGKL